MPDDTGTTGTTGITDTAAETTSPAAETASPVTQTPTDAAGGCPVIHGAAAHGTGASIHGTGASIHGTATGAPRHAGPTRSADRAPQPAQGGGNRTWWPERLNVRLLAKNPVETSPYGDGFDYAAAFGALDLAAVKADIAEVLTTPQSWWPPDFGNYGPLVIRMAWHSAGTYRVQDGRGGGGTGQQRFAPLNSWPDNVGLDKARRVLWPVKKKYGRSLSWGDLMILAGNVALEQMGLKTFGFAGGRPDVWEPDEDVYWGPESSWLGDERYGDDHELENPLAAVQMGLIYTNPEGPGGNPDPLLAADDIRETFKRMAMDDEETVALIAGGHTFGKTHGAGPVEGHVGDAPETAPMEQMGLGWKSSFGSGMGDDTIGGGPEVTWTYHPTRWDNEYFHILFGYEWELMESPAGAKQWRPKDGGGSDMVPMAHDPATRREPRMLTIDLSLRFDPAYEKISRRFANDQKAFEDAFARAWFKLTHRDMGPRERYLGPEVPAEKLIWQDPLPERTGPELSEAEIDELKLLVRESELTVAQLVSTAWASASSFRGSDKRGGANGARIRFEPQRSWEVNDPARLAEVLDALEGIRADFNRGHAAQVSLADLIVLAGGVGVEQAAKAAGVEVRVPFHQGRVDARLEDTDVESFAYLEPIADGFRNHVGPAATMPAEYHLIDRASLLTLTAPQMTVLVGGLRVLGANQGGSAYGVFTETPGVLTNDFFVNLLDMGTSWAPLDAGGNAFEGTDTATGEKRWVGTRADLVFGSNSELRAQAEVYASDDARETFVHDFVAAWVKVMELDRFDLHG